MKTDILRVTIQINVDDQLENDMLKIFLTGLNVLHAACKIPANLKKILGGSTPGETYKQIHKIVETKVTSMTLIPSEAAETPLSLSLSDASARPKVKVARATMVREHSVTSIHTMKMPLGIKAATLDKREANG